MTQQHIRNAEYDFAALAWPSCTPTSVHGRMQSVDAAWIQMRRYNIIIMGRIPPHRCAVCARKTFAALSPNERGELSQKSLSFLRVCRCLEYLHRVCVGRSHAPSAKNNHADPTMASRERHRGANSRGAFWTPSQWEIRIVMRNTLLSYSAREMFLFRTAVTQTAASTRFPRQLSN